MADGYLHVEVQMTQTPKRAGEPCGDVVVSERNEAHTTLACVDGVGSGMKARIAARMCASRLCGLLQNGFSLREAFTAVAETMNQWRDPAKPYAAFTVARIRNDGVATSLSYDAPPPLLVSPRQATAAGRQTTAMGQGPGDRDRESVVARRRTVADERWDHAGRASAHSIPPDGATREWLGMCSNALVRGRRCRRCRDSSTPKRSDCGIRPVMTARPRWPIAAPVASSRCSPVLPSQEQLDGDAVRQFMELPGTKVVCGGTTAEIVARWLGQQVEVSDDAISMVAPPRYDIAGIDLVTEGAVTLNQTYNLFDADVSQLRDRSGVTALL